MHLHLSLINLTSRIAVQDYTHNIPIQSLPSAFLGFSISN